MVTQTKRLNYQEIHQFQCFILGYFKIYGRMFPWRETVDPYSILVSELMLQQTQTFRVVPKYIAFLKQFPSLEKLAQASLSEVLNLWQGLGYNRRALYLIKLSQEVIQNYNGVLPKSVKALEKLPGIGPYTAAAVAAFAFNQPEILIETNIRTVFFYHFFSGKEKVNDMSLQPLIKQTLYMENPRIWYWALMDYGAMLKREIGNFNLQSKHYSKQSSFEGSNRQIRGQIIKNLLTKKIVSKNQLVKIIDRDKKTLMQLIQQMEKEELIHINGDKIGLKN